jgi:ring-1,2-phenylacetyl-CoA epoxidase subunit PaaE
VYSQVKVEESLFGRIDKSVVNFVLSNKHKELEFDKFYLCGPEDMINTVSAVLKKKKCKESAIKFELLRVQLKLQIKDLGGHSKITIMVDDEETTFEMSQSKPF